jgi:co-chaperonin GroES (HSP10)
MERLKDFSKGVLRGDGVLAEIIEKKSKSGLILPDTVENTDFADYIEVIAVGENVTDLKPGYIILDVRDQMATFLVKDRRLVIIPRNTILFATPPDNFDFGKEEEEPSPDSLNV